IKDELTDIYYRDGKAYVKLVFDTSTLNLYEDIFNYNLYVNVEVYNYSDGLFNLRFYDPDEDSNVIFYILCNFFYNITKGKLKRIYQINIKMTLLICF
ncbi:hypothetical protein MHK_001485, partial [Candidatus Magnetomorum sp. HK-1]